MNGLGELSNLMGSDGRLMQSIIFGDLENNLSIVKKIKTETLEITEFNSEETYDIPDLNDIEDKEGYQDSERSVEGGVSDDNNSEKFVHGHIMANEEANQMFEICAATVEEDYEKFEQALEEKTKKVSETSNGNYVKEDDYDEESDHVSDVSEGNGEVVDDDKDFWAVLSSGVNNDVNSVEHKEPLTSTIYSSTEKAMANSQLSKTSNTNSDDFTNIEKIDSVEDEELFEAISAIAYLMGEVCDDDVSQCGGETEMAHQTNNDEEGDVDFWAVLQEEVDKRQFEVKNNDDVDDKNSWSLLGFSDIFFDGPGSTTNNTPVPHAIREVSSKDEKDDFHGVVLGKDEHIKEESIDLEDNRDANEDALDFLEGALLWGEVDLVFADHAGEQLEGKQDKASLGSSFETSDFECIDDNKDCTISPDNLHGGILMILSNNETIEPVNSKGYGNEERNQVIAQESDLNPLGTVLSEDLTETSRKTHCPKPSMIPKPKKQNQQRNKSAAAESHTSNDNIDAVERTSNPRSHDRGQRRRGSLSPFSFVLVHVPECVIFHEFGQIL